MHPLTILITNVTLWGRSGTEVVVGQLADGMRRAGHRPIVYTASAGPTAEAMRHRGHVVIDRLAALPTRPDVIHGHHNMMTMAALAGLPGVPALFVCHDATAMHDAPPLHPRIRRYFIAGGSATLITRLVGAGIPREQIAVLPNAVDEQRYRPRAPLPDRPLRALAIAGAPAHLGALRAACAARALPLDVLGNAVGRISERLEEALPQYDIVFASGRSALEAAFTGCAVVVCDERGMAGPVTAATAKEWWGRNFGGNLLAHHCTETRLADAIALYDAADATEVGRRLRAEAALGRQVEMLVGLYREIIQAGATSGPEEAPQIARFIEDYVPTFNLQRPWRRLAEQVGAGEVTMPAVMRLRDELLAALDARVIAGATEAATGALASMQNSLTRDLAILREFRREERDLLIRLNEAVGKVEAIAQYGHAERILRRLYRRILPSAVRSPLHAIRGRFHSWLEGT